MSAHPLVTALICNYNYGCYLADAIDSALDQTWQPLEVVVVDDGSTDESREVLARYEHRARVILKENGGQASAFNAGIAAAQGEIICFLDSDDIWRPGKVEQIVEKFQSGPWGLVCHEVEDMDEGGLVIAAEAPGQRLSYDLREGDLLDELQQRGYPWFFSPTSGMSLRTDIARALLPLPEEGWRICADNLIAFGAVCHAPAGVVRRKLAAYRYHSANGFARLREREAAFEVELAIQRARRFQCVDDQLARLGRTSARTPKEHYPLYRFLCLVAHRRPSRGLPRLWRLAALHFGDRDKTAWRRLKTFLRCAVSDAAAVCVVTLGLSAHYRELRQEFQKAAARLDARSVEYITSA